MIESSFGDYHLDYNIIIKEIRKCLDESLFISAITTTNLLLEHFLKNSLIYKYSLDNKNENTVQIINFFEIGFNKFNSLNLFDTIEAAYGMSILNNEEKSQLHIFRDSIRNAYSHADKSKIFRDTKLPVSVIQFDKNNVNKSDEKVSQEINLTNLPFIQGFMMKKHAESNAKIYFDFVENLINNSLRKLFPESFEKFYNEKK